MQRLANESAPVQRLQNLQKMVEVGFLPVQREILDEEEKEPGQFKAIKAGELVQREEFKDEESEVGQFKKRGTDEMVQTKPQTFGEDKGGLPSQLKQGIESLSGISMDGVKVHRNSSAPAKVGAHAYAQDKNIHLGPGQEKHLPHEAWHVVQQAQGRVKPTMQLKAGIAVNDDAGLEREADVMGAKASQQQPIQNNTSLGSEHLTQAMAHNKGCGCPNCAPQLIMKMKTDRDAVQLYSIAPLQLVKKCMYCGIDFSEETAGKPCPEKGSKSGFSGKHHFIKEKKERVKNAPPSAEEIEKRQSLKKERKAKQERVKPKISDSSPTATVKAKSPPKKSSSKSVGSTRSAANVVAYTKANTGLLVKYLKLLHKLRLKLGSLTWEQRRVATAFRKQCGVYCIKLGHFCDSLLDSMLSCSGEDLEAGLNLEEDKAYILKQRKYISELIELLAGMPGVVDFQSCDSAFIDLDVQYARAVDHLSRIIAELESSGEESAESTEEIKDDL